MRAEARQHGVGFYSFSKDEEERAKQMEELERIRKQTEAARAQTTQTSTDKQSALEERLKKVRDRKRKKLGLPPLSKKCERLMVSKITVICLFVLLCLQRSILNFRPHLLSWSLKPRLLLTAQRKRKIT